MNPFHVIQQYYRYRQNWKKVQSRLRKGVAYKNRDQQLQFYSQWIRPGDLVFDVGANVGDKTDLFLEIGARVVAVEPQFSCWKVLQRRFGGRPVSVEPYALSFGRGKAAFYVDRSTTLSSMSRDWIEAVRASGRLKPIAAGSSSV